jgi:hypothetical protein
MSPDLETDAPEPNVSAAGLPGPCTLCMASRDDGTRQTWRSQKALPVRACGFKSRSRHKFCPRTKPSLPRPANLIRICQWPAGSLGMRTGHFLPSSTVELALKLSDAGLADRDNAEIFGVAVNTVRRWRHVYQRLGLPRAPYNPLRLCPRCGDRDLLDEEAYAHLLGWYLGDGSLALLRRGVYVLQVDTDNAYPGLMDEIEQSMRRVKPDGSVHRTARKGCKAIKCSGSIGPACFHNTDRAGSTTERSP